MRPGHRTARRRYLVAYDVRDPVRLRTVHRMGHLEVRPSHFVVRAGGVALTAEGRKAVISAYERRLDVEVTHPVYRYRITYRRVLEVQARVLAAWLLGEVSDYAAFTTR